MSSKKHGGHDDEGHGGQWKVAYADFVTAMMAFFLIMWLVSSATETDRAVIAKYFSNSSLFNLPAGNGVLNGGKSVMDGSEANSPRLTPSAGGGRARKEGATQTGQTSAPAAPQGQGSNDAGSQAAQAAAQSDSQAAPSNSQSAQMSQAQMSQAGNDRLERQRIEAIKAELERMMQQGELRDAAGNMAVETTPEGLRIQIFDRDGEAMFQPGGAEPTPRLTGILSVISQVLQAVPNSIILAGHTDADALQHGNYSNWELSSDRANATRRQLESDGLNTTRFVRVEGRAAADLLLPQSPTDPRNRRIAVTVLRSDAAANQTNAP